MKVAGLIEWLLTLEQDYEIGYFHENGNREDIDFIHADENKKEYTLG